MSGCVVYRVQLSSMVVPGAPADGQGAFRGILHWALIVHHKQTRAASQAGLSERPPHLGQHAARDVQGCEGRHSISIVERQIQPVPTAISCACMHACTLVSCCLQRMGCTLATCAGRLQAPPACSVRSKQEAYQKAPVQKSLPCSSASNLLLYTWSSAGVAAPKGGVGCLTLPERGRWRATPAAY